MFHFLKRDELLKDSALLFAATTVVNAGNMGFQMVMGRALSPSDFSLLASLLGVLVIFGRPASILATAISHYTSIMQREERLHDVARLVRRWLFRMGLPACAGTAIVLLAADPLARFFHLERVAPVVTASLAVPAMMMGAVLSGTCQGLQRFAWIALSSVVGACFRLGGGTFLVVYVHPAAGYALLGHSASLYAASGLLGVLLWSHLRGGKDSGAKLPSLRFYLLQSFFIQISYAVLMTADVVLAKHYVPAEADTFAYAATLGRIVVFLPTAIAAAMFPKVSSRGTGSASQQRLFSQALLYTVVCTGGAVGCCLLFPGLLLRILFGIMHPSAELVALARVMAGVMMCSALLNVVIQFLLAQRRFAVASICVAGAAAYLVSAWLLHTSVWHLVLAAGIANGGSLLLILLLVFRKGHDPQLPPPEE